jgi:hypothetical protein
MAPAPAAPYRSEVTRQQSGREEAPMAIDTRPPGATSPPPPGAAACGRDLGEEGLNAYTQTKTVWVGLD